MKHISGTGIAVAFAGLALVVAAGGATYAVAATTVTIVDPTTPTRKAGVDATGHLVTTGAVSTIDAAGYLTGFTENSFTYLTSPTTASLAITRVRLSNPGRNGANEEQLALYTVGVDGSGACTSSTTSMLGYYDLTAGDESLDTLDSPILVKPTGGAKYCLAVYVVANEGDQGYYVTYSLAAYVANGSYTGIGVHATSPVPTDSSPQIVSGTTP